MKLQVQFLVIKRGGRWARIATGRADMLLMYTSVFMLVSFVLCYSLFCLYFDDGSIWFFFFLQNINSSMNIINTSK